MIVKFFSKPTAGKPRSCKACIDYLLNKPDNHAKILQGNPFLSEKIADSLSFSNTYTSGCLSFEEKDLSDKQKREIMARFEEMMFVGLSPEQYNISWVQHTDKDRLELNFVIPNVEMTSGKRFQPYFDKADRPLVENFKQVINYDYQLSDPNSPDKRQSFVLADNLPKDKKQLLSTINDAMMNLALAGKIQNRQDVILALQQAGFEIARITPKNLSIKTDGQNLRLKGEFYEQDFRISSSLQNDIRKRAEAYRANHAERYRTAHQKFAQAVERRRANHTQRYPNRAEQLHEVLERTVLGHHKNHPQSLQNSTLLPIQRDDNNGCGFALPVVASQNQLHTNENVAEIRSNSERPHEWHYGFNLWRGEPRPSLRSSLFSRRLDDKRRQRKRNSLENNRTTGVENDDRERKTFRERLDRLINVARERAEYVISKIGQFRARKPTVTDTIREHQPTVGKIERIAELCGKLESKFGVVNEQLILPKIQRHNSSYKSRMKI